MCLYGYVHMCLYIYIRNSVLSFMTLASISLAYVKAFKYARSYASPL